MTHPHHHRPATPPDLDDAELGVAAWFGHLERTDAPAQLRRDVLTGAASRPAGRLLRFLSPEAFPLGGWGLATAALLLVAFGAAAFVELGDAATAPVSSGTQAGSPVDPLTILEDPTLALFHDLQTFDEVGRESDELLADWVR